MASMATERKKMREAQKEQPTPPWELVALDDEGAELYRTGSFYTREEARADADAFDEGTAYWTKNISDEVDSFEPRKRR